MKTTKTTKVRIIGVFFFLQAFTVKKKLIQLTELKKIKMFVFLVLIIYLFFTNKIHLCRRYSCFLFALLLS